MSNYKTHKYSLEIKEHHLDTFGHVNNATYLSLMEEARWELITEGGFGLDTIQQKQIGPIILACNIKFIKELKLRQQISIQSQVIAYRKKVGEIQQTISNADGEVSADAVFTIGLFDMKARKLMQPTEGWLHAIGVSESA